MSAYRFLLIAMLCFMTGCSTSGSTAHRTLAHPFAAQPRHHTIDGWYQVKVRMERNADIERPFVPTARTARAPLYRQLIDMRRNQDGVPPLYCDYLFTYDQQDRLRSVAVQEESCSQNPV